MYTPSNRGGRTKHRAGMGRLLAHQLAGSEQHYGSNTAEDRIDWNGQRFTNGTPIRPCLPPNGAHGTYYAPIRRVQWQPPLRQRMDVHNGLTAEHLRYSYRVFAVHTGTPTRSTADCTDGSTYLLSLVHADRSPSPPTTARPNRTHRSTVTTPVAKSETELSR